MDEKRVADYFIISGVSEKVEQNTESKPLINSVLPITDITVIFKSLGEQCPIGYTCIEYTPGGHIADLNNGNFKSPNIHICYKRGSVKAPLVEVGVYHQDRDRVLPDVEVIYETPYGRSASTGNTSPKCGTFITYRRAKTKSPYSQLVVVDLCVILNNKSEHPPHAFYSIRKNLNKSYYGMIGSEVFLCYKKTLLSPPSICYQPQIISRFPLQDLANFPLPDTVPLFCLPAGASIELRPTDSPLPKPIASTFVLTSDSAQKIYGSSLSFYEPYDSNLLSAEQKARLKFCDGDNTNTKQQQQQQQQTENGDHAVSDHYETYAIKSICILSRWPFFECFEKFLFFLHKLVFPPGISNPNSPVSNIYYNNNNNKGNIPLEHHISHFLLDVSFPTSQRPTVMVQLMPGTDETLTISQPSSQLPLPLTGASFIHLLATLGVENTMNVLLFGLCEQKILLHSLNPWLLTTVAEAITAMLFPFHWQCPYVPLCPLSLYGILNAPLPFIVGIDSRCFDTFTPPEDVICVDLDTRSIFLTELKKCLNVRILPKRASRVLRNSLDEIFQKWIRVSQALGANQSPQHRTPAMEASRQQLKRKFELEIQEAFVRFMATILRGFRSYLLPITKAPTVGATDPTSLFDFEGFLMSRERSHGQFYQLITKTQLFTHYIEERSFVSDKDTSLAFFDDCEERLTAAEDSLMNKPIKLFEKYDELIETDRSVYIPAPEQSPPVSHNNSVTFDESPVRGHSSSKSLQQQKLLLKFGPLDAALFHRHPAASSNFPPLDKAFKLNQNAKSQLSILDETTKAPNNSFSIARRTKQEVEASRRTARKSARGPQEWSRYLVSCCYCLWFSLLPSYISYCKDLTTAKSSDEEEEKTKLIIEVEGGGETNGDQQNADQVVKSESEKTTARILRHAYSATVRMQRLQLTTDEVCFRILTLLCGHYGHPALAVRVFFEMRKAGIKPNAITYGYYNTALLESRWPDHSGKPTTVLWTKIRNVIMGIALFKFHGRMRMGRRDKCSVPLLGGHDMNFGHRNLNVVTKTNNTSSTPAASRDDLFVRPTTMPISKEMLDDDNDRLLSHEATSHRGFNQHRRSLINHAFSNYQKSALDVANPSKSEIIEYDNDNAEAKPTAPSGQHTRRGGIRKSHSMHARSGSAQARGLLSRSSSYGDDDDDEDDDVDERLIETAAAAKVPKSKANESLVFLSSEYTRKGPALNQQQQDDDSFLIEPQQENDEQTVCETKTVNLIRQVATSPTTTTNYTARQSLNNSADFLHAGDDGSSEDTRSNRLSESITDDPSTGNPSNDIEFNSMDAISTPNFKLSSLINDASNLQWSKWTSSQNSKSVYKNIKSVATGLVSSLQEIKSSFSMSESATPSKLMSTVQHKSTNTREMLSQWATQWGYFLSQTSGSLEGGDGGGGGELNSDDESATSEDLLNLVDDDNFEQSSVETNDFQVHHRQLIESERQFNLSSCKNDFLNHLYEPPTSEKTDDNEEEDRVAISIKLTTCFRCNACQSMLNDDEIMGRWSCNESNLNTKCVYCRAKIVPMMTVQIEDRRFISQFGSSEAGENEEEVTQMTENLVDMNFDECDRAVVREDQHEEEHSKPKQLEENLVDLEESEKVSEKNGQQTDGLQPGDKSKPNWINFSFMVPYLSPIVLRKELESVFESAGDSCPASCRFIDEHPIIFWNLLWYFSRIGVPTHLAYLCLESKSILNGRTLPAAPPTPDGGQLASRDKVVVDILWDTE